MLPELNSKSPLFTLLENTDNGVPLLEAENALREIVLASRQFGGAGSLTLKISTQTVFGKGTPQTKVVITLAKKVPTVSPGVSTFFAAEDGSLTRDDPAQLEFDLSGKGQPISIKARRGAGAPAPAKSGKAKGEEATWPQAVAAGQ